MAQVATANGPVIPNDTGANFRADVNENLADLYSTSSGSSAPPAAVDNQMWIDTSTTPDTLKVKQGSSWISLGTISTNMGLAPAASPTFTGNLNIPAGSSSSLPLRVTGDTDTGLFFATNTVNIHAGGTTVHEFTASASTPKVPVRGQTGSASSPTYSFASDTNTGIYRPSADNLCVSTGGGHRVTVNSSGLTVRDQKGIVLADADSSHTVTIKPPSTVPSNYTLTLPQNDGSNNQILKSDGSGTLSWTTVDTLSNPVSTVVKQVVGTVGPGTNSSIYYNSSSWTTVLSQQITLASSSNQALVQWAGGFAYGDEATARLAGRLVRTVGGSDTQIFYNEHVVKRDSVHGGQTKGFQSAFNRLDSPGTTSQITYAFQVKKTAGNNNTFYVKDNYHSLICTEIDNP